MNHVSLKFDGMEELKAALRRLPEELAVDAGHLVQGVANGIVADVRRAYPIRTGHLVAGVHTTHLDRGKWTVAIRVVSNAKHAWIYEYGTVARHYYEDKSGKRHATGAQRPRPTFVPAMIKGRREMWRELRALLERKGLIVSGSEAA